MKTSVFASVLSAALLSQAAFAGGAAVTYPATMNAASKTQTKGYVGLNWTLGGGAVPALVLGVSRVKVKSDGDTDGARLAFYLDLARGFAPGALKLSYLNGKENLQGELGLGYNFAKAAPMLGIGLNAPYVAAGFDAYLNPGFVPYGLLHSQGKFRKPGMTPSCNPGDTLINPSTCQQAGGAPE